MAYPHQLIVLLTGLLITGCTSLPVLQPALQTPAPVTQLAPSQMSASRVTQSIKSQPNSQASAPSKVTAPAVQPLAAPTPGAFATQTPAIHIARNYNTQTLLVGLRSAEDLPAAQALIRHLNLEVDRYLKGIHALVLKTRGQEVTQLVEKLSSHPLFAFVETDQISTQKPEQEKEIEESFSLFSTAQVNDKYFKDQYGLEALHVPEAWNHSRGQGVVVAVIDTGVSMGHPDLKSRVVPGYDALSLKEGGTTGDVSSLNYLFSSYKHGSHVAGIIAAEANNGHGIAGVAPAAKIMPIKIYPDVPDIISSILAPEPDANQTMISIIADGIIWAADHGAHVINLSLMVTEYSITLERAVKYALDKNVSVIVAAGNDRQTNNARNYLAAVEGAIAVGATDYNNNITVFSNSGDYVSVSAPGHNIISSVPSFLRMRPYVEMSGTSMAAPHVAGVAALLRSKFGSLATPAWIKQRLEKTALDRGTPGRDDLFGHGLVNALRALTDPV